MEEDRPPLKWKNNEVFFSQTHRLVTNGTWTLGGLILKWPPFLDHTFLTKIIATIEFLVKFWLNECNLPEGRTASLNVNFYLPYHLFIF